MENVQAKIISAPSPVPAKAGATEAPVDADGAPLPSAFLAALSQQVKNLKCAPALYAQGTDPNAPDKDAALAATDFALPAEPAAIDLQLLVALPPALPPADPSTASDAAASGVAPDPAAAAAAAAVASAAATIAASAAAALAAPAAAAVAVAVAAAPALVAAAAPTLAAPASSVPAPLQAVAAKPQLSASEAKSAANATAGSAPDAARKGTTDAAPAPLVTATHEGFNASTTASQAAHAELLRTAEHTPLISADGRENSTPTVPQLAFTQALSDARSAPTITPAAQLQVDTPLGSAGWGTELGQKVVWMVGDKQQVAELRINPPNLGPLDIKLTIDDQQTTAVFTSPHASVRDAVESALPRLREVLAESGIMLGNASVTSDTPRDGSAFSEAPARTPAAVREEAQREAALRLAPGTGSPVRGRGLVDLFA